MWTAAMQNEWRMEHVAGSGKSVSKGANLIVQLAAVPPIIESKTQNLAVHTSVDLFSSPGYGEHLEVSLPKVPTLSVS